MNSGGIQLHILIEEARNGSEKAFREIFEHLNDRLFLYCLSHTKGRDDALDILQDTFVELWIGLQKFSYKSDEAFYGFIFTILKRKLIRYYKKSKRKTVSLEENGLDPSYEMEKEDHRYLLRHISALGEKYQDLLRLRYWSGMTFGEISSVLGITESAAKVRHHRALQKLRVNLHEHGNTI
ncbi:sigma-70 family RNA polymerase sigma factor [Patescibacteria group bacterium]|nr:sigma-70 family RNA polymerase sigma factor [Patescibacteria group bacterium]